MKRLIFVSFLLIAYISGMKAQHLSSIVQKACDACMNMRLAIEAGNTIGLRAANRELKECQLEEFVSLECIDENPLPLDGHFVFDDRFVDELIADRKVYEFAQRYANPTNRGTSSYEKKIFAKNCAVRKSSVSKFILKSRGHQELVVVTEPKGLVTLRVHDTTHDKWYKDATAENEGKAMRALVFDLPTNERSYLELEIINCSDNDCSFIIISN